MTQTVRIQMVDRNYGHTEWTVDTVEEAMAWFNDTDAKAENDIYIDVITKNVFGKIKMIETIEMYEA